MKNKFHSLLLVTLVLALGYQAWGDVKIQESNIGTTFDFVTLNELNQLANTSADLIQESSPEAKAFEQNVDNFLTSGISDMGNFVSLIDGNDKMNQAFTGRRIVQGDLHPAILRAFFKVLIGPILESREVLNSRFNRQAKIKNYENELFLAGLIITQHSIAGHNFKNLKEDNIRKHVVLGKKALLVHGLLAALDIRACSSKLEIADFLSAIWFLEAYLHRILPNRFGSVYIGGDECSTKIYHELGFGYLDFIEQHARKTYLKKL